MLFVAVLCLVLVGWLISALQNITPAGIVIHHTGPLTNGEPVTMKLLERFHESRGFGAFYYGHVYHVGYHYVIFPDGHVVEGRPDHLRGAHTLHYNNYLGIVLVGDFSRRDNPRGEHGLEAPTEAQLSSLVLLCRRLRDEYNIPLDHVEPHSELGRTLCPGGRFPWKEFLSRLQVQPQPHSPPLK